MNFLIQQFLLGSWVVRICSSFLFLYSIWSLFIIHKAAFVKIICTFLQNDACDLKQSIRKGHCLLNTRYDFLMSQYLCAKFYLLVKLNRNFVKNLDFCFVWWWHAQKCTYLRNFKFQCMLCTRIVVYVCKKIIWTSIVKFYVA